MSRYSCPFYKNDACGIGNGGFRCSLESGIPYTDCYPYKVAMASKKKCPKCGHTWESMAAGLSVLGLGGRISVIGSDPSKCPRCGQMESKSSKHGSGDRAGGSSNVARCKNCGAIFPASDDRCPSCGG
jgi:hypothetical protein